MENLPKRLAAVVSLIPSGKVVADIGTDHGLLPVCLVRSGKSQRVIASDIHRGPFQKAKMYIRFEDLEGYIDIRLGSGLQVLQPGEVEVVVIAGLGGNTMVEILTEAPGVLATVKTLVLNPVTHQSEVRRWLAGNGWSLVDEDLVKDQGRLYQIISAYQGIQPEEGIWSEVEYEFGPIILRKRHPLLKEYLSRKLKKYEKAVNNLKYSHSTQSAEKLKSLLKSIEDIRELHDSLLECQEDK